MTITSQTQAIDADAAIAEMVERLAAAFDPDRIVLFGSRARGDAREWSDVDLLVVMPDGTDRRASELDMRGHLRDVPLKTDIVVTTPGVIERAGHFVTSVLRPALLEGLVLHERNPPSTVLIRAVAAWKRNISSAEPSDPANVAEALTWLRWSRDDLRSVERMLDIHPPITNTACYVSQQAGEKALKAAYQLDSVEFEPTHQLDDLWDGLANTWPGVTDPEALEWLSEWETRGRYPSNLPEATVADARQAQVVAQEIYDGVVAGFRRRGADVHSGPSDSSAPASPPPDEVPDLAAPRLPGFDL